MMGPYACAVMNFLNLGCGKRFHHEWTNVDYTSTKGSKILACDLTGGVPFSDSSFSVVYHSHLLEHLSIEQAKEFLRDCHRVLCEKGIIRVAVPDLEQIVHNYLIAFNCALSGSDKDANNYHWILLELFDQMTRNYSGGKMAEYLSQNHIPNKDFVLERLGAEAHSLIECNCSQKQPAGFRTNWVEKTSILFSKIIKDSTCRRNIFLRFLLMPEEYKSLKIGQFRQGGENHQWMYDRYSLAPYT